MAKLEFLKLILSLVLILASFVYNICVTIKYLRKKKKDGTLTNEDIEASKLKIKEIARNAIYEAEEKFKSLRAQGIKSGALKLDSVLKAVSLECLKLNLTFDENDIKEFVNQEINKMKGVV